MIHTQEFHAPATANLRVRLAGLFTGDQLDAAMDRAAGASRAVVAVFAASPVDCWNEHCDGGEAAAVEWVIEFFVPPPSLEQFHRELESQLLQMSRTYVAGRTRGAFAPCVLRNVAGGTFHQYRYATKCGGLPVGDWRWSVNRDYVTGVMHQARVGWQSM